MRLHEGDQVTVVPTADDPQILQYQRYVTVARRTDEGYMVRVADARPPARGPWLVAERGQAVLGPIPEERLQLGWRDADGAWR